MCCVPIVSLQSNHPDYTNAVRQALNNIDVSLPVDVLRAKVYEIQARAANAFIEYGAVLKNNLTPESTWLKYLIQ